jgi:hypothetical protein
MEWYRNDRRFSESSPPGHVNYEMKQNTTYRYKLCVKNPVNKICSAEIFASSTGVAASFESVNYLKRYIRHRNSLGELTPVTNNLDSQDIAFFLRPGLNGSASSVSFESVNYPGHFLRHQGYRIKLHLNDRSELFGKDATFIVRPGLKRLADSVSFESINFPGYFIRHQNFQLWIAKNDSSQLFQLDASFHQSNHYVGHLQPPVQVQPREYVPVPGGASRQNPSAAAKVLQQKPTSTAVSATNQCVSGFVWRGASSTDYVCVTAESRARVAQENATAASRVNPKGAYGPNTCIAGYVWREAFPGDVVCVTPQVRTLVQQENDLAANRRQ